MKKALPLVIVTWDDAFTAESGITLQDVTAHHKPEVITTIGWVLRDNEVGIMLANEFYDETYRGRTFIPRGMVKTMTVYTLTKPRAPKTTTTTGQGDKTE